jgi:hypothetical protein
MKDPFNAGAHKEVLDRLLELSEMIGYKPTQNLRLELGELVMVANKAESLTEKTLDTLREKFQIQSKKNIRYILSLCDKILFSR